MKIRNFATAFVKIGLKSKQKCFQINSIDNRK